MEGRHAPKEEEQPSRRYEVVALGSFGDAVLRCVRELSPHATYSVASREDVFEGRLSASSVAYVLIAQGPEAELCDRLGDDAHRDGVAFLPLMREAHRLRFGPVVLPGQGGCWHCAERRWLQHGVELQDPSEPQTDPAIYAQLAGARLAGARLAWMLGELERGLLQGGTTWRIDLNTTEVQQSHVIGVHGCSRCGVQRPLGTMSIDQMRLECMDLWTPTTDAT